MLVFLFGLVIGSFLNVVICRMPDARSVVFPPSHCTQCQHQLGFWDLIPVLSYCWLRGKCRYCQTRIKLRYPLVELLTGFLLWTAYHYFGLTFSFWRVAVLMLFLIPITFIDLDTMTIPDRLSLGGALLGFIFAFYDGHLRIALVGALSGGAIIYAIYLLGLLVYKQETIGGGDVKLMFMIGMFVGVKLVLLTLFLAMLAGSVIGVALIATKIKSRKDFIPFGPFISLGCVVAVFFHRQLLELYGGFVLH